jgi:hypothetical protein
MCFILPDHRSIVRLHRIVAAAELDDAGWRGIHFGEGRWSDMHAAAADGHTKARACYHFIC